ncbi:PHD domain-containing protein/DDT domain-containing protein [Cephalotus follicularis]|uniref:PHD domain-containing protein/DDT domain-containing protein n=1 Tax=Cephalotus follicularis TaxID=3775 RepID=A0A1Q3C5R0_CEPFO|nr:PHD domain-containing protein/DDT domain-containing protein [Cephalotus follicularis]
MEFVGKSLKKDFKGHGVFTGTVRSYDASTGFFDVVYEDGDSEELDFNEVASLFHKASATAAEPCRLGRKPKRRRVVEPPQRKPRGNGRETLSEGVNNGNVLRSNAVVVVDLNESDGGVHDNFVENCNGFLDVDLSDGIDLNAGFNFKLNDGICLDANCHEEESLLKKKERECIDLNLDVCGGGDVEDNSCVVETQKRECCFDLNLGVDDNEFKECNDLNVVEDDAGGLIEGAVVEGVVSSGTLVDVQVAEDSSVGYVRGIRKVSIVSGEGIMASDSSRAELKEGVTEPGNAGCQGGIRIAPKPGRGRRKRINVLDSVGLHGVQFNKDVSVPGKAVVDGFQGDMASAYKPGRGKSKRNVVDSMDVTTEIAVCKPHDCNGVQLKEGDTEPDSADVVGSDYKQGSGRRKSRSYSMDDMAETMRGDTNIVFGEDVKVHDSDGVQLKELVSEPSSEALDVYQCDMGSEYKHRRGRKRRKVEENVNATMDMVLRRSVRRGSARNNVLSTTLDDVSFSPADSALREEKPVTSNCERHEEPIFLPPKLRLPPSSQNLDLGGIPVLDVFSIYACLRSFSTFLFLSPFEMEDFVAALKCNSPCTLFDYIHVSILQTLRKNLEYLSNEGSESASNCLRCLNWDLLDLITWPIFMVEYLLIHGSGLRPGFDLSRLKLFKIDYHRQPASVKVEILRCLCDDMIEIEAIRLELSRRSSAEPDMDHDRNANTEVCKKKRALMDVSAGSCLTEDVVDDTIDWNSDECCLCRMDGSLICCDGCPAAYHSKCVGVANDLLPEGDWYCPECIIERHKSKMKPRKSLQGAELLGIDPHGRLYFNSCSYLLVSDSYDTEFLFNFYHRNDLNSVIDVLKSSGVFYSGLIKAIYKQWQIPVTSNGARSNLDVGNTACPDMLMDERNPAVSVPLPSLASSGVSAYDQSAGEGKMDSDVLDFGVSESVNLLNSVTAMETTCINLEGTAEPTKLSLANQNLQIQGAEYFNRSIVLTNQSEIPEKSPTFGDISLTSFCTDIKQENDKDFAALCHTSSKTHTRKGDTSEVQCGSGYMNYYSFAQTASSVVEELTRKLLDKTNEESILSVEDVIAKQMKAILKNSKKFYWPNFQNLNVDALKEKCGWCFSCKGLTDDMDCLFKVNMGLVKEGIKSEEVGLQSIRDNKGHLVDAIRHILSIEDRLHGLLLGPWLNPHYTKLWRRSVMTSDIMSIKHSLLTLESNLHRLALSAEWLKHVDSAVTMGSASHVVIASSRASLKHGIGRKRARGSDFEINPSKSAVGGLGICWWRGGKISRQLFSWKVLPSSLALKAARQAGHIKIPGIFYPEGSDFAKRSKYIAWRAAVESSTSVEQLYFQVRELDSNIRWNDLENTHPMSILDKESRKSVRLFKKAIVRRKCVEDLKYLLDFGKRRIIPDVVVRHGAVVEESSSVRKKYWLNECHVPLHLLKSFEEKRIARKCNKMTSGKLAEGSRLGKKVSKKRGFSYLFSRAERSEYYQCGHCNKDVPIRESVSCQYCKGFFHKRHVRKSDGVITAESTYACHRCQEGFIKNVTKAGKIRRKRSKFNTSRQKVQPQQSKQASAASTARRSMRLKNKKKFLVGVQPVWSRSDNKVVAGVPLRRSPRKVKFVLAEKKGKLKCQKGKGKFEKGIQKYKKTPRKPKKGTHWQKKRTITYHSYWLNGLLLSRKPDDKRVLQFRRKRFFAASECLTVSLDLPRCLLCCELEYKSTLNYIACEICEEWFHGDAYGLVVENISKLIGFRCHACRNKTPPVCPLMLATRTDGYELPKEQMVGCTDDVCNAVPLPGEVIMRQQSNVNEDLQGLFPLDGCLHKEGQLGTISDMDQSFLSESNLEVQSGPLHADNS